MRPQAARRRPVQADKLGQRRHRPDYVLLLFAVILLVVGLIVVYAISPGLAVQKQVDDNYFVTKQMITIMLGIITFGLVSQIPLKFWQRLSTPLVVLATVATLIALVSPVSAEYPAHRWIRFGGQSLQSVELIKFALVICLAGFLAKKIRAGAIADTRKTLQPLLIVLGILGVVVAGAQADLGSTGVLVVMVAAMAYVAGLPLKRVFQISAIIIVGTVIAISSSGYRRERVMTFLNPEKDCQNAGYQACQALIAVGSGGVAGKGLGHGAQAFGYLPEASNDSIFAIIAEKFGFIGTSLIIALFVGLFSRIKNILERAPDATSKLMVTGVLAWLSTQTFINIGSMIGLFPLKGITLPFISAGGTSVIFVTAAVGLVFQISRYTTFGVNTETEGRSPSDENTVNWRRDRRPYYANPSRRA
ncbi:MAG: putative peptidoglycan glycosyltransferase FtsW [Patescibacteria group bacterium]